MSYRPLAEQLSRQATVVNYDRRGRGDSGGAEALPKGQFRLLEGQEHVVPAELLAPVLAGFLAG